MIHLDRVFFFLPEYFGSWGSCETSGDVTPESRCLAMCLWLERGHESREFQCSVGAGSVVSFFCSLLFLRFSYFWR